MRVESRRSKEAECGPENGFIAYRILAKITIQQRFARIFPPAKCGPPRGEKIQDPG